MVTPEKSESIKKEYQYSPGKTHHRGFLQKLQASGARIWLVILFGLMLNFCVVAYFHLTFFGRCYGFGCRSSAEEQFFYSQQDIYENVSCIVAPIIMIVGSALYFVGKRLEKKNIYQAGLLIASLPIGIALIMFLMFVVNLGKVR